ncbi:MAG: SH3 domain-containing protein [Clostridia bacterium]|nr:SH3 domain-containing protein [Clostridia bacterium]
MSKSGKLLLSFSTVVLLLFVSTSFAFANATKNGVVTGDAVNLRAQANTSAGIIAKVAKGTQVTILEESNGWYNVSLGSTKGWMSGQFVSLTSGQAATGESAVQGRIIAESVNFRSSPSLSSKVIARLNEGDPVSVLENADKWSRIKTSAGVEGWVYSQFVSTAAANVSRSDTEVVTKQEASKEAESADIGQQMVEYARKFLGVQYVYGGASPKGFDCSGFTTYVYKHFGISLSRVAADQAKQGKYVEKENLLAGDLVFFDTDGGKDYICHVGIYIGDGNFIHASSGRNSKRVVISDLSSGFYANAYITARRLID